LQKGKEQEYTKETAMALQPKENLKSILLRVEKTFNSSFAETIEISRELADVVKGLKAQLTGAILRIVGLERRFEQQSQQLEQQSQQLEQQSQQLEQQSQQLTLLIAKVTDLESQVASYTGSDGRMLMSMYAFSRAHKDIIKRAPRADLAFNSQRVREMCEDKGFEYSRANDPHYGFVWVYPQEVLEGAFLDTDSRLYIGWQVAPVGYGHWGYEM
jgi:uncharacterized coiled-coil protein SlyX